MFSLGRLCRFSIKAVTSLAVRTSEGYAQPLAIVDSLMEWKTCWLDAGATSPTGCFWDR